MPTNIPMTDDVGGQSGSGSAIAAGDFAVVVPPARGLRRIFLHAAADKTCAFLVQVTHDNGTTWTTVKVGASAAKSVNSGEGDDSTYVNVVELVDYALPMHHRVLLKNTGASAMAFRYSRWGRSAE